MEQTKILVVEDDELMLDFLTQALSEEDYQVLAEDNAEDALQRFQENDPDLVITDIRMPKRSGTEFLGDIREEDQKIPVIMITAYAETSTAIEALKAQADDFLKKPFEAPTLIKTVKKHLKWDEPSRSRIRGFEPVYASEEMGDILEQAGAVASERGPVLIEGESGVGKEVIARYIHYQSPRADQPMVTVNCGAIPGELLESELFGHEQGAFTGATEAREGLFKTANHGTLFLDEIGELPQPLQSKLLRAIEHQQIKPVGSDQANSVDVRILAASNQNLQERVQTNDFREDLFYRLNVFNIELPPLRERLADVEPLIAHFCQRFDVDVTFSSEGMEGLRSYQWPGNVRELQNFVRRLRTLPAGETIDEEILARMGIGYESGSSEQGGEAPPFPPEPDLETALRSIKTDYIERALKETGGNRAEAARLLGMNRTTLVEAIKRLSIETDP